MFFVKKKISQELALETRAAPKYFEIYLEVPSIVVLMNLY